MAWEEVQAVLEKVVLYLPMKQLPNRFLPLHTRVCLFFKRHICFFGLPMHFAWAHSVFTLGWRQTKKQEHYNMCLNFLKALSIAAHGRDTYFLR